MSGNLVDAILYLIRVVFDLYMYVLIIRLILGCVGADSTLPVAQFVIKLSSFIIRPMRKIIPDIGRLETATLVLLIIMALIKHFLLILIPFGFPNIIGLLILGIADPIYLLIQAFTYAILFQAIFSWLQPGLPINRVLYEFTSPILRPIQRILPPVGGIDISPIIAIVLLQLVVILLVSPLLSIGQRIAVG